MSLAKILACARETESDALRHWRWLNDEIKRVRLELVRVQWGMLMILRAREHDDPGEVEDAMAAALDQLLNRAKLLRTKHRQLLDAKLVWAEQHGGMQDGERARGEAAHERGAAQAHGGEAGRSVRRAPRR